MGNPAPVGAEDRSKKKFHDAAFARYEGAQSSPPGNKAELVADFAVPICVSLRTKPYRVLGRIYGDARAGSAS